MAGGGSGHGGHDGAGDTVRPLSPPLHNGRGPHPPAVAGSDDDRRGVLCHRGAGAVLVPELAANYTESAAYGFADRGGGQVAMVPKGRAVDLRAHRDVACSTEAESMESGSKTYKRTVAGRSVVVRFAQALCRLLDDGRSLLRGQTWRRLHLTQRRVSFSGVAP